MKAAKKGITIIVSIVLWAIILLAALFAFTTLATRDEMNVSSLAGFTPMMVETDSMAPTFSAGDLILIKKTDPASLKEGDIITFHTIIENQYALNTHRIDSIVEQNGMRSYITKGDNNDIPDTHVIADGDIVGKYVGKVSGLGKVMKFLSSSVGFLVVIVLPLLLFFIYQIYNLIMVSINLKKAVAMEEAKEKAMAEKNADAEKEMTQKNADAEKTEREKAEAALAEAKRLQAEAEATLAKINGAKEEDK
ncbi:MAG: signal peptidase I [Lachnospiraceae bacterium]|nr:signal peptidase I [Lachnospiraceae bacterium]